jgi:hypothetical protein
VVVCDVRNVHEAELAWIALANECSAPLTSYGLLLDDADFYRSLLARRPLLALRPEARGARAVADVARLIRADAASDAG